MNNIKYKAQHKYYWKNRDKIVEKQRQWRKGRYDEINEKARLKYANDPEYREKIRLKNKKNHARIKLDIFKRLSNKLNNLKGGELTMKKLIIMILALGVFSFNAHAKEITITKPYEVEECTTSIEEEEYTVHHEETTEYGEWERTIFCDIRKDTCKISNWRYYERSKEVIPAWDETKTREVEVTTCGDVVYYSHEKQKVFTKDNRCLATKPLDVTWSVYENNLLTWSAVGGDKVEVRFGYNKDNLVYSFITSNDGHEKVGIGTDAGWWTGYWQIRTLNGCRAGNWSPVLSGHGSW